MNCSLLCVCVWESIFEESKSAINEIYLYACSFPRTKYEILSAMVREMKGRQVFVLGVRGAVYRSCGFLSFVDGDFSTWTGWTRSDFIPYLSSNLSEQLHLLCPLDDNIFHPCVYITMG